MQTLMVKSGSRYRKATAAEVAEVAGFHLREELNRARPQIREARAVADQVQAMYAGLDHEVFTVLFLDTHHRLQQAVELFRGTIDAAAVYSREVVKEALWRGAAAVILVHNHPSGSLEPSAADMQVTSHLQAALALLDIRVLDHLLVSRNGFTSFAERGLM